MFDFGSLIGPGMDLISNLFGGGRGGDQARGYQDYMRAMQQGTDQANGYLNPFYQAGRGEISPYQKNYQQMMSPEFIKGIMNEYQESPFAKMQLEKGKGAINNAASASGMLGSTDFGKDQADYARQITSADQNQYLQNRLGAYNTGLGHQGGMVGMGGQYGQMMGNNAMNLGHALGQGMQGQRFGEGQQRDDTLRGIGGIGKSIFDYLGDSGAPEAAGRARLPTPQFRRYG